MYSIFKFQSHYSSLVIQESEIFKHLLAQLGHQIKERLSIRANVRKLQYGEDLIESDVDTTEIRKMLAMLMAPGSSLGGVRPKANLAMQNKHQYFLK